MASSEQTLSLDTADALLTAWAQELAERIGVDALLLKGRTLSYHRLREAHVSSDVDLLVDPRRFEEYCDSLIAAGWSELPSTFVTEFFTLHSRTFARSGWPNSLDIHRFFPGFLSDPTEVFDRLWARREYMNIAHRACVIADRTSSVLILALHSLRSTKKNERHRRELEKLVQERVEPHEIDDIVALATETGSLAPLYEVLVALGANLKLEPDVFMTSSFRDWQQIVAESNGAPANWHRVVQRASWRQKPRVIFRAFWPSTRDLMRSYPNESRNAYGRTRLRLARLTRGIRSMLRSRRTERPIVAHFH